MDDRNRYLYFYTLDSTGVYTTSGYTLPITPFTFVPIFDDGTAQYYSSQNILWDFGDGTTSEAITATHQYKVPGWYNVKCYFLGKDGIGYQDKFSQSILVKDFISDTIVLSGNSSNISESGKLQNPFTIIRFNSWQTYPILSSVGYTINLHVTGNNAPLLNVSEYNQDKFGHLKPTTRFITEIYNPLTEKSELLPVNELITSNTELYVRLNNNTLQFCNSAANGACFAGTSGIKTFYYVEDLPKTIENNTVALLAATIFTSFDTNNFKDKDNYNKNYIVSSFNILNSVFDTNTFSKTIEQLNSDRLHITSNGLDDDNDGNIIDTFNIHPEKFVNQKIPFVVRVKDTVNGINTFGESFTKTYTSKYNPILHYVGNTIPLTGTNIRLYLKNDRNQNLTDGITFYEDLGPLSGETYGGYFKGYLVSTKQLNNVKIYAEALPTLTERLLAETSYAAIGQPILQKIHNITIQTDTATSAKQLTDHLYDVTGLSGIYTTCVVNKRELDGSTSDYIWLADSDRDIIKKYDAKTMNLLYTYSLYNNFGIENGTPSNLASDKDGNIWITLYDSISTIKINNISNIIDAYIVPNRQNQVINDENTITPASVDTDIENNVWVSYSNELSGFIEKYNSSGNYLLTVNLTGNHQPTELITDINLNAWVILKDRTTVTEILSAKQDKVAKISPAGLVTYYPISGSLGNIAIDLNLNVWITRNRNEVTRLNTSTNIISTFSLSSSSDPSIYNTNSDFAGIACTTDNDIMVVDNYNRCIRVFRAFEFGSISDTILPLDFIYDPYSRITAYGDWNGFRYINKYQRIFGISLPLSGSSNNFSIYSADTGQYDVRKINENFDAKEQLKSYRYQETLQGAETLFNDFIGSFVGTLSSSPNELMKKLYEKVSNFTDNIAFVDTCNVDTLKSMYKMFDESFVSFHGDNLNIPANLYRLIDLFSIKFSKLKGSRNKYAQNYDDKGYNNDLIRLNGQTPIYGFNKGSELNFFTAVLSTTNPIIAYEKFSDEYKMVNTALLSTTYIQFRDLSATTYSLSSYHPNWGWGLILPNNYVLSSYEIPKYYSFYEYVSGFDNKQTEGLINWQDAYTTITENVSSSDQWNSYIENLITYSLSKGLSVIK